MPHLDWNGKPSSNSLPTLEEIGGSRRGALFTEAIVQPLGSDGRGKPANRLILGDNLEIMEALLPEYEGRIQLIYADPPFFTNRKYQARIGRGENSRRPGDWALAAGYHDLWDDLDSYLTFLYERLALMHRLLAPSGTLYLHLDWHADAYARLILDEIFRADHLLNEIIWAYHGPSPIRSAFNRKHDTILAYVKGEGYTFNVDAVRVPYDSATLKTFASSRKAGFGKVPDLARGKVPEDWWYFPVVARLHNERTGYPTQKPEALLERIIRASSNPGDLLADFFCGSGTTPLVAAREGRRFLGGDASWRAVHTTRARLVSLPSTAFTIERTQPSPIPAAPAADFGLRLEGGIVSLEPREEIVYWEIDPDWDGLVFRSGAQAVRPVRDGLIRASLPLGEQKTGHPSPKLGAARAVCVRLVMAGGEQFEVCMDS
jgi:DNA modification methylase